MSGGAVWGSQPCPALRSWRSGYPDVRARVRPERFAVRGLRPKGQGFKRRARRVREALGCRAGVGPWRAWATSQAWHGAVAGGQTCASVPGLQWELWYRVSSSDDTQAHAGGDCVPLQMARASMWIPVPHGVLPGPGTRCRGVQPPQ